MRIIKRTVKNMLVSRDLVMDRNYKTRPYDMYPQTITVALGLTIPILNVLDM